MTRTSVLPPENTPQEPTGESTASQAAEPGSQSVQRHAGRSSEEKQFIKFQIAARRLQVGRLYRARMGQQEIADGLGVDSKLPSAGI